MKKNIFISDIRALLGAIVLMLSLSVGAEEANQSHGHSHDHDEHIHKNIDETKQTHLKKVQTESSLSKDTCQRINVEVNGLVCDFCARALEKVFRKKGLSDKISVDLAEGLVDIHLKDGKSVDDRTLTKLITDSGYNVVRINRECKPS